MDSIIRDRPIGPGPVRCTALASAVPKAFKSAPAQKVPPFPHKTATEADSSRSNSANAE
ncbi:enoyl-CoA hydratase domain protein [Mycobacterium ulcerans str. Harvey]|uniref:Enoyl-CoA hydratase domain protein n=1 Tax=Mycobacterium ulcerans str. Harvey TaxID=1299332 RepID=A0ABN0R592_MYCUL|nr:enoyl-CoA hydratase domain protein [Mycobacterium ulcerans str. Harvey]